MGSSASLTASDHGNTLSIPHPTPELSTNYLCFQSTSSKYLLTLHHSMSCAPGPLHMLFLSYTTFFISPLLGFQ